MNNKINTKKGFSIGEVLLALFVLAFGITTSIYLMAGSMQDTMRSRDLLVASMLSQEGTELMRNIRDNNVTEKDPGTGVRNDPFYGFPSSNSSCSVDYSFDADNENNDSSFLSDLSCGTSSYDLYLSEDDTGVMFYTHNGGELTKFKRKIIIGYASGKRSITSMVVWNGRDFPNSKEDCNIGQDCTYSETILTAWIDIE